MIFLVALRQGRDRRAIGVTYRSPITIVSAKCFHLVEFCSCAMVFLLCLYCDSLVHKVLFFKLIYLFIFCYLGDHQSSDWSLQAIHFCAHSQSSFYESALGLAHRVPSVTWQLFTALYFLMATCPIALLTKDCISFYI